MIHFNRLSTLFKCENRLHLQITIIYSVIFLYFIWLAYWSATNAAGKDLLDRMQSMFNRDHKVLGVSKYIIWMILLSVVAIISYSIYIIKGNRSKDKHQRKMVIQLKNAVLGGVIALLIAVLGELKLWIAPFFFVTFLLLGNIANKIVL